MAIDKEITCCFTGHIDLPPGGDLALYPDASHVGMVVGRNEAGKLLVCRGRRKTCVNDKK